MILKFYMKSGNSFEVKRVKLYEIKYKSTNNENIIGLKIIYRRFNTKGLLVESIALNQIEAITKV